MKFINVYEYSIKLKLMKRSYIPCFVKQTLVKLLSLIGQTVLTTRLEFVVTITESPIAVSHSCKADCDMNTISLASLSEMLLREAVIYNI